MQNAVGRTQRKSSTRVVLLGLAVVAVSSGVYYFWPALKAIRPVAAAVKELNNEVALTAIVYSEEGALAIVDGKIVHEEDAIGDVKVLKIRKDSVEFEQSGKRWSQSLCPAEEGVRSGVPVLLELGSEGCPPCRQMMPILNKLKAKYAGKFQVRYIDVWKNRAAGNKYGVTMIPTQIFYDSEGREVFRHVGFYSEQEILATWKSLGVKL